METNTSTPTPSAPASPISTPITSPLTVSIELLSLLAFDPPTPTAAPNGSSGLQRSSTLKESSHYKTSNYRTHLSDFPPELIALITHHLYYSLIPTPNYCPSPDPHLYLIPATSAYAPPSFEPTPSEQAREAFSNLCLVDSHWGEEGRKALWRNLSIGMPRAFQSVLQTIEEYQTGRRQRRIQRRMTSRGGVELFDEVEHLRISSGQSDWTEMDDGMPLELDINGKQVDWNDIGIDGPWKDLKQDADGIGSDQRIGGDTPRHGEFESLCFDVRANESLQSD